MAPTTTEVTVDYERGAQVNIGTPEAPVMQHCRFVSAIKRSIAVKTKDMQTNDDRGADNQVAVAKTATITFNIQARRAEDGSYLPEFQALLDAAQDPDKIGNDAKILCREFDKPAHGTPNSDDAIEGEFTVSMESNASGSDGDANTYSVTLTGNGQYSKIVNPWTGWGAVAPVITGASPAGAGSGDPVALTGTDFLGVTGVTVDGDPVEFLFQEPTIVIVLPVDAAGDVDIVVTNAAGASEAFVYTRDA